MEHQGLVTPEIDAGCVVGVDNLEAIAAAPVVVALTAHHSRCDSRGWRSKEACCRRIQPSLPMTATRTAASETVQAIAYGTATWLALGTRRR